MRAELLFSLILVALGASAVRAHPTTPNDAIGAPTIAQLFLDTGRARLELEVGEADLRIFAELLNPPPNTSTAMRDQAFFARRSILETDDGTILEGRVKQIQRRPRVRRDPITGNPLPPDPHAESVVVIELEFAMPGEPTMLLIRPLVGPSGATATMGLVVYHRAIAVNDFDYVKQPIQLRLDWRDPWQSEFRGLRLKRYYNTPAWFALEIDAREVRWEFIIRPTQIRHWLGLPKVNTLPDATAAVELANQLSEELSRRLKLLVDDTPLSVSAEPTQFLRQGLARIEPVRTANDAERETLLVQLTFVAKLKTRPQTVELGWHGTPPPLDSVPLWVNTSTVPQLLTTQKPTFTWHNSIPPPTRSSDRHTVPGVPAWFVPTLSIVVFAVGLGFLWRIRSSSWRGARIGAALVAIILGVVAWPYARIHGPLVFAQPLSDAGAAELASDVLLETYDAFQTRDEEAIYDTLATTIAGPLLKQAYLALQQTIHNEASVGRSRIRSVVVLSNSVGQLTPTSIRTDTAWSVEVAVSHLGHTHLRTNQYRAKLHLEPHDGRWKLTELSLADETPATTRPAGSP